MVAKEWTEGIDESFATSLFSLQGEINALAARGRVVNARLNVREIIAPMLFLGVSPQSAETLFSMMRSVSAARHSLDQLLKKLSLLADELSLTVEGGVA